MPLDCIVQCICLHLNQGTGLCTPHHQNAAKAQCRLHVITMYKLIHYACSCHSLTHDAAAVAALHLCLCFSCLDCEQNIRVLRRCQQLIRTGSLMAKSFPKLLQDRMQTYQLLCMHLALLLLNTALEQLLSSELSMQSLGLCL